MSEFAIRVELKGNPTFDKYETLHAVMARLGFYQKVNGTSTTNGAAVQVDLPHAVYYGSSTGGCIPVRDSVATAIKATVQQSIIVFVVQVAGWAITS
jgi:hypothetical protein